MEDIKLDSTSLDAGHQDGQLEKVTHYEVEDVVMNENEQENHGGSPSPQIWSINVRSPKLPNGQVSVPTIPEGSLHSIVEFVNEVLGQATGIEVDFTKIIHKGKRLDLQSSVRDSLIDGDTVLLLFTPRQEIEAMRKAEKVDHRIRSFEEEEALEQKRLAASSVASQSFWGEEQDARYKFVKFEVCSRFVTPHPFDAEKLLLKLATDPAIKKIMRKYQWTVGVLAEMDPKSDMIALRREAEDGACVLGYNENAGHKIYLRLRTDDEREFRGYDGLINTLLHELTHNVRGPHDEEFWKIFGQLKAEYLKFHETEYRQGSSQARRVINAEAKVSREIRSQAGNSALSQSERRAAASVVSSANTQQVHQPYIPTRLGATNSRARRDEREKLAKAAEARLMPQQQEKCDCGHPEHHHQQLEKSEHKVDSKKTKPTVISSTVSSPAVLQPQEPTNFKTAAPVTILEEEQKQPISKDQAHPTPISSTPATGVRAMKVYHEPAPLGLDEALTSDREKRIRQAIIRLCKSRNEDSANLVYVIIRNALTGEAKFKSVKASSEKFKRMVDSAGIYLLESVGFERREDAFVLTRDDPGLLILARMLLDDSNLVTTS